MKVKVFPHSEYFSSLEETNSKEELLEEFERSVLTVEEMREIFRQREKEVSHTCYDIELKVDDQTGRYYVNHSFCLESDLLITHLLVEQLLACKDNVDWERVTEYFDYEALDRIYDALKYPLVWVPAEEVGEFCVVKGRVAKEVSPPDGYDDDDRYALVAQLRYTGLLWFADNLPVFSQMPNQRRYRRMPPDMIVWDRLFEGSIEAETTLKLQANLEFIARERGGAKAAKIVERLRKDWKDIFTLGLFGTNEFKAEIKYLAKDFENFLFVKIERFYKAWKAEAKQTKEKPSDNTTSPQAAEELFRFIHPKVTDDDERRKVHQEVKNLVSHFPLPEIFNHLSNMADDERIYYRTLNHAVVRKELERLGLPDESIPNFSMKTFEKYFM